MHSSVVPAEALAAEADPGRDCSESPADDSFELVTMGGPDDQSRRRPDNREGLSQATGSGVTAGSYRLLPVDLTAGSTTFIQTCESNRRDVRDYPFVPFAKGAADGSISFSLVAGEALVCDWYEGPAGNAD